jgi:pyrroline-5-carboxylate reductase
MRLGVIGLGNMATAMIGGITGAGIVAPADIRGYDPVSARREELEKTAGIETCDSNEAAVSESDYVILAVKPQIYEQVLP